MKHAFYIAAGQDTGGQGFRMAQAMNRHVNGWDARAMHVSDTYIDYPSDLKFDAALARRLYEEADVVHHRNTVAFYEALDIVGRDRALCKPTVLHHHGSRLRTGKDEVHGEGLAIGAVQLVSTVDLLDDAPGAEWLPAPFDLDVLPDYRRERRPGSRLRIGHAPTNREVKGTDVILDTLNDLSERHDIEVDLIEGATWAECLRRKGRCDLWIDQTTLGYGNNAIEAWGMSIPVVSAFEELSDRIRFLKSIDAAGPPFIDATALPAENPRRVLYKMLERAITEPELRDAHGKAGRAYVERWHDERRVAARLKVIYESAPPTTGTRPILQDDMVVRNAVARAMGIRIKKRPGPQRTAAPVEGFVGVHDGR